MLRRSALLLVAGCLLVAGACGTTPSRSASAPATAPSGTDLGDATGAASGTGTDGMTGTTVDPGTLPQTTDRPTTTSPAFTAGTAALWQAVAADDPDLAMPFFFPLSAYRQVKAVADPSADWHNRLVSAFRRDIHQLHQRLGTGAADATFEALQVPDSAARWVKPGEEYNKLGYWRVYGSTLRYRQGGTDHDLPIYSLISWRGEWYVVHVGHP